MSWILFIKLEKVIILSFIAEKNPVLSQSFIRYQLKYIYEILALAFDFLTLKYIVIVIKS